jgi:hypothetical protein
MHDSTGTDRDSNDQDLTMDAAAAAAIMAEASDRARRRFEPDHRVMYAVWGPIWLLGYGIQWLAVRGQHPFRGPNPGAYAAIVLISAAAALITVGQARAETGLRGPSVLRQDTLFLSTVAGFGAMFALEGALLRAGASRPVVGIFEASAPILVLGLLYLVRFSADRNWIGAGLGLWLVVVAAVGGYTGPKTVWAVGALAVGLAYLLVAAVKTRVRRA